MADLANATIYQTSPPQGILWAMSAYNVTGLGKAYHRHNGDKPFGIKERDRLLHLSAFGQTGTGKSSLIQHMAISDARARRGFCLIDPHGDLARAVSAAIDVPHIYWDVADPNSPYGYNPLTKTSAPFRPLVASGLIDTLKKQWSDAWGPRLEHLLRMAILSLLELPQTDMSDITRLYLNKEFRKQVIAQMTDPYLLHFWTEEFAAMNYATSMDGVPPIANKLSGLMSHPVVRKALCEPEEPLRFRRMMDQGKIIIVNLAKGRLGADIANLVGGLLVSSIANAAFSRHDIPQHERRFFGCYVDEFASFSTDAFADVLAELRKYGCGWVMSAQTTSQISKPVLSAILGNVGSLFCFRVGAEDAPLLSRQLLDITPAELVNLPNHRAFVRLMVDGVQTKAFTAETWPPQTISLPT